MNVVKSILSKMIPRSLSPSPPDSFPPSPTPQFTSSPPPPPPTYKPSSLDKLSKDLTPFRYEFMSEREISLGERLKQSDSILHDRTSKIQRGAENPSPRTYCLLA